MFPDIVQTVLSRELRALRRNIELYPTEESMWVIPPGISNSGGTLALHLAGNMQQYIGKQFGGSSYVRDRPAEFSRRNVPRAEVLHEIDAALAAVALGMPKASDTVLSAEYPEKIGGHSLIAVDFLVHLVAHMGYHVGQVDYHRRLVTGENRSADAVSVPELPTIPAAP